MYHVEMVLSTKMSLVIKVQRGKEMCYISSLFKLEDVTNLQHNAISEDPYKVNITNIIQYASYDPLGSKTNVHSQ